MEKEWKGSFANPQVTLSEKGDPARLAPASISLCNNPALEKHLTARAPWGWACLQPFPGHSFLSPFPHSAAGTSRGHVPIQVRGQLKSLPLLRGHHKKQPKAQQDEKKHRNLRWWHTMHCPVTPIYRSVGQSVLQHCASAHTTHEETSAQGEKSLSGF